MLWATHKYSRELVLALALTAAVPFFAHAVEGDASGNTLTENVDQSEQNAEEAQQDSEDCNPQEEDCGEREQVAADQREQQDANQASLDSINERLKNSGYQLDSFDADGNPRFTDATGAPLKKLGEAELGYSRATRDGNVIDRYGATDRGVSVETVRDANGQVTDLRVNEFNGDSTFGNAGAERQLASIDSNQLADLRVDPTTSGPIHAPTPPSTTAVNSNNTGTSTTNGPISDPGPTTSSRGVSSSNGPPPSTSEPSSTGNINDGPTPTSAATEPNTLTNLAERAFTSATDLYNDTLTAANDFLTELQNPVKQPEPVVQHSVQRAEGYTAKAAGTGETIYSAPGSRDRNDQRIAVVVDTGDSNVAHRMQLAENRTVYAASLKTTDLTSAGVQEFIQRYPNHRIDIMTHGFSQYDGGIQTSAGATSNNFLYAGSERFNNFFSSFNNEVCLYACNVGATLYNSNGSLNTNSFQYQASRLTNAPVTASDRPTYPGGYQSVGTNRYTLTVPAPVNPYPRLTANIVTTVSTPQTWSTLYSTLQLIQ